jgi:hypothetical protein
MAKSNPKNRMEGASAALRPVGKSLRGVKHWPGRRLDYPSLQRAYPGIAVAEMGFEFSQGAVFPFTGLFQQRQPLNGTKRRRLTVQ